MDEAIDNANDDAQTHTDCTAGNGADTIELSEDITLSASVPNITTSMTIDGNGYTISGSGGNNRNFRLAEVAASSRAITVTITDVTIDDFRHDTRGTLEVDNSTATVTISQSRLHRQYQLQQQQRGRRNSASQREQLSYHGERLQEQQQ